MDRRALCIGISLSAIALAGCSSGSGASSGTVTLGSLGLVQGPADTHCGSNVVTVDPNRCKTPRDTSGEVPYPPTMFNGEGDDDQCKYHIRWGVSAVAQNTDATFTVVLTSKATGDALRAAPLSAEVYLDDTHPAPPTNQASAETSTPGTYTVGPIRFDAAGRWTVRFHIHEECFGRDESPHGHGAFFVQIP